MPPPWLRGLNELNRAAWRDCYVVTAKQMTDQGRLEPIRADFVRKKADLQREGFALYASRALELVKEGRGGKKFVMLTAPKCGEIVFKWWPDEHTRGAAALFDDYRNSGRKTGHYTDEEAQLIREVIAGRLTEERP